MIILRKIESKHFNSDTSEVIRLTLKHDGSEYVCRIHAYSWRNTCRVVLSKNGDQLLDITADEKCTFTEAVKAARRLVLLFAGASFTANIASLAA